MRPLTVNLPPLACALVLAAPLEAQSCEQKLLADDASMDANYGSDLAVDGGLGRAVVAAAREDSGGTDAGAAYILERSPWGAWLETAKLLPSDVAPGLGFASDVDLAGDLAVIGGRYADVAAPEQGAVYLFERDPAGSWIEGQKLSAADGASGDRFGTSVAVDGTRLLVGAYRDDGSGTDSGSAYLFEDPGTGWVQIQKLLASDESAGSLFGSTVSLSGDLALVAANRDSGAASQAGAVYVFERDALSGDYLEIQKLLPADPVVDGRFGFSVALDGERALIGALGAHAGGVDGGAAYVFERDSGSGQWNEVEKLTSPLPGAGAWFGLDVDLDGDCALIGEPKSDLAASDAGAVHLYRRDGVSGTWSHALERSPSDAAAQDQFGFRVRIEGATGWIGSFGDDDAGAFTGAVYRQDLSDLDGDGQADGCQNVGSVTCVAPVLNSTGLGASLSAFGVPLPASASLHLRSADLPPNQFGYLLTSLTPGQIQQPGGSQGILCLGGQIKRFIQLLQNSGSGGGFDFFVDPGALPPPGPSAVLAGDTWYFQAWYRDFNPGPTSNFSAALEIQFL